MTPGPLDRIRVLDASQMMSGPLCAMRLGDFGADVLKIEPTGQGEWTRTHGFANCEADRENPSVIALNRNKRSVTINLKNPDGLEILYSLVRQSDVFIQNYRVGTAERLGVDYNRLSQINPRIVYCSISGYGEEGPYRLRPGQDLLIQGLSGSMWSVGTRHDPPRPGALWCVDGITAYQAVNGILAALIARERTGKGQKVETNLLACVMDLQIQELTAFLNFGVLPTRTEEPSAHALINAPYGVYRTADGHMVLAMAPLDRLGEALNDDRLRQMTSWTDGFEHRDEVYRIVRSAMQNRTTAEWLEIMDRLNIWAGPVYTYRQLIDDPHVRQTGMITQIKHSSLGDVQMPAVPVRFSDSSVDVRLPAPQLGEHTDAVLQDLLGYDSIRLEQLHNSGAI